MNPVTKLIASTVEERLNVIRTSLISELRPYIPFHAYEPSSGIIETLLFCPHLHCSLTNPSQGAKIIRPKDFSSDQEWSKVLQAYGQEVNQIEIPPFWNFDRIGIIPAQASLKLLRLIIGSHNPATQELANTILPCRVFNLSITPETQIEETHRRMKTKFHPDGGEWQRW